MLLILLSLWACITVAVAQVCNGYSELCGRKWSNISQIGTHDSAFVGDLPTENQDIDITAQLDAGVRFLQAQTHYFLGVLTLCHTSCWEENAGPAVNYLSDIKKWLDANPNEVVSLLLTNGDNIPVGNFSAVMEASGLANYAYTPPHTLAIDEWPTLQEMITAGDRLVMFLDYGADTNIAPSAAAKTNAATGVGSIGAQADLCTETWGRKPRVMLLDFFNTGNALAAQNTLNGL
ncbi:hypothetical protein EYC84_001141 [Monilinia fructicola]|nr:hypothetical protein EYC84_001141 [Monilinia fructicola]